tara:strand:+ start:777 stop:1370 length:594 start_codon:yes stop_codon:yes gene_type:complete
MANTVIQLRNSTVTGNIPSSLANGEISINNQDGKFFYSTPSGSIVTHYPYLGPSGLDTEIQFNDSGTIGGSQKLTFNKTTGELIVDGTVRSNVFVANTGYIQFSDGSKQYTANAGSGGGGTTDFGFGIIYTANNDTYANAAAANSQVNFVGESGVVVFANSITKTITVAGTPGAQGLTVDYGFVYDPVNYSIDYGTL